jgi:pyruvate/2-oxoglutarate dehydrogenase complex dihydrolipoamide acyltransferase (E2) component
MGDFTITRPSFERQLAIDAYAAMPPCHLMTALVELDVTDAVAAIAELRRRGVRVSLFAFLVRSIAIAIAEHPDLNLIRHGRSLVRFSDVDVAVPVEVTTPAGNFPRQVVLRAAQLRSAPELYAELEAARDRYRQTGDLCAEDRGLRRFMKLLRLVPAFIRILVIRRFMRSAFRVKERAGTTLVTSVGKFAAIPGFGFSFTTGPRAAAFAIGSVVDKPWVHRGSLAIRSVVALSIMLNHDLLDGGPAARFARRLQELVEGADGLEVTPPAPVPLVSEP